VIKKGDASDLTDLPASATVSPADVADAKRIADADLPRLRPAFNAELLPKDQQADGPIADTESDA
jgi:hypothetical protein